jgi:hypothetical protein
LKAALDTALQHDKPCFEAETVAILARLRGAWVVCSDETGVRPCCTDQRAGAVSLP